MRYMGLFPRARKHPEPEASTERDYFRSQRSIPKQQLAPNGIISEA
jgi:hypothetical protein